MNATLGGRVLKTVAVTAIVAWSIGPIVLGVLTSISTQRDVTAVPSHWLPAHATTTAYRELGVGVADITAEGVVEAVERVVCILDREPRLRHGLLLRSLTSAS